MADMNTEKYLRIIARAIFLKMEIRAIENSSKPLQKPGMLMGMPMSMMGNQMMTGGMGGMGMGMGGRIPGMGYMSQASMGARPEDYMQWNMMYPMGRGMPPQMYGYPKYS